MKTLGQKIRKLRIAAGLSQAQLAAQEEALKLLPDGEYNALYAQYLQRRNNNAVDLDTAITITAQSPVRHTLELGFDIS